jgi:FlaA1/EpsC-like NDP-sugar epimerase
MSNRNRQSAHPWSSVTQSSLRALALLTLYAMVLGACRYLAYELRFDFVVAREFQEERLLSLVLNLPIKLLFLALFRQFGVLLTYFSVPDLLRIAAAMASANLVSYLLRIGVTPGIVSPRGVVLIDFVLSVGALSFMRLAFRIYRERYAGGEQREAKRKVRRVAVLGAGDAGAQFVQEAQARPSLGLKPVFFLDDAWQKHGHHIHGVPVLGAPEEIGRLRKDNLVDTCVIAMPSAPGKRLQELYRLLRGEDLPVEIIPSMSELASGRVQVTKIRPVQVDDLLGRETVDLRSDDVAKIVAGKVVLVTGAGGSIGSELCRQLLGYHPERLLMAEQSEGSLFTIESELNDLGHRSTILPLVADLLDTPRMHFIFERFKPQVVFHAAAHKHVFMMERQPGEAVKNNTTGTRLLAELASASSVETMVFISTDKAINPTSVMGATKRLAEMCLQHVQKQPGNRTKFIAVRFGNVLGSSGSVIPIFKKQIEAGGPVTVTHPDVTRYFMTIPEAVGLVLRTAHLGSGGEIFVLDMGKPVKIVDLAHQLIELSGLRPGEDIEIKYIGLKPGEKLFEELQHQSEMLLPTPHPRITRLGVQTPMARDWNERCLNSLERKVTTLESNQLKLAIKELVPEYHPYLDPS